MIVQPDLFSEPPAQLHSTTSRMAAASIENHAPTLRQRVYDLICAKGPITDERIAEITKLNPSTARPRRIELVAAGLVMAAPESQKTSSGRQATAWVRSGGF